MKNNYVEFLNFFCDQQENDLKLITLHNGLIFGGSLILILASKSLRVPLIALLVFYAAIMLIINRWDEKRYHMRRYLRRTISFGYFSLLLIAAASYAYFIFIGNPVFFIVITLSALVVLWILNYHFAKKLLNKINYNITRPQSGSFFGPGIFGAFGVLGVAVGRTMLTGLNNSQAAFIGACLLAAWAFIYSFAGQDFVALELLLKNPGLDEECWKAREALKEKGQGTSANSNPQH